mgnify:CR=1 FL=1
MKTIKKSTEKSLINEFILNFERDALKKKNKNTKAQESYEDAQKTAFKVIMFKGIPGTELNIPLIVDLDGTLIHTDMLCESFLIAIRNNLFVFLFFQLLSLDFQ